MDFGTEFQKRINAIVRYKNKSEIGILDALTLNSKDLENTKPFREGNPPRYVEIVIDKKKQLIEGVNGIDITDISLYTNTFHVCADIEPTPLMLFTFIDENREEHRYIVIIGDFWILYLLRYTKLLCIALVSMVALASFILWSFVEISKDK